jgi:ATP-dependent DNA helicase RecG
MSETVRTVPADPLELDVQFVKGVGPNNAKLFAKAGISTVRDLLYTLPRRYEDRRNLPPIGKLRPGQFATVRGKLIGFDGRPLRGGKVVIKAALSDGTGSVTLVWFNQPWVKKKLEGYRGELIAYGQVKESGWAFEIHSPEYELVDEENDGEAFARIVPVYPLTEGLSLWLFRKAAQAAVERYAGAVEEPLPAWLRTAYKLKPLPWCLRQVHLPESDEARQDARRRLVFEEFLYLQIALEQKRLETHSEAGISFRISQLGGMTPTRPDSQLFTEKHALREGETLWDEVHRMLPFELTAAQRRVIGEIWSDMERPYPMNRLVQGDVGAGKTAVAACAMLAAVRCGYQAAMMAPTEILAEQHYNNLRRLFDPLGIEVVLLVGKQSKGQKKTAVAKTKGSHAQIAVGTHALIQESVAFDKLGLVVIDEQHRFGVLQRAALRDKGVGMPDVLVMTATPIPRTLTMTLYGDLDLSIIDELPPGRKPIKTHHKGLEMRERVYQQVRELIAQGRQAYFVCPMVSESEKLQAQAAEDLHYRLTHEVYPDLRVGLLHGQMKPKEKEAVMEQFRKHELDILVSTTVIEVGVDVPNATVMIVEDANRFGLAQLHQLRGRVGRGDHQSFCILLADTKNEEAEARMGIMVETTDGFRIAEEDLRLRGPGDMLGTKQSGMMDFEIADLVQDSAQLEIARQAAQKVLAKDPSLTDPQHALLRKKVANQRLKWSAILVS